MGASGGGPDQEQGRVGWLIKINFTNNTEKKF